MYRTFIFSAALVAATTTYSWSQVGNSAQTLPTPAPGANVDVPNANVKANALPSVSAQVQSTAPAGQSPAQGNFQGANATVNGSVGSGATVNAQSTQTAADDNKWRFKFHNNHWWYYQPDNTWVIYYNNAWVPYSADTYATYYPSNRTYGTDYVQGGYVTQGYQPSYNTYYRGPQRYNSFYRGGYGYGNGYGNGYYGNGYYGNGYYGNGYYGNRDLRYSDGSPGGNIGATLGGSIGRDAGGRSGGNVGAAIGGAIGSGW